MKIVLLSCAVAEKNKYFNETWSSCGAKRQFAVKSFIYFYEFVSILPSLSVITHKMKGTLKTIENVEGSIRFRTNKKRDEKVIKNAFVISKKCLLHPWRRSKRNFFLHTTIKFSKAKPRAYTFITIFIYSAHENNLHIIFPFYFYFHFKRI